MITLSQVRAIKALPDRVEIHTSGAGMYVIRLGLDRVSLLCRRLHRPRGRRPVATFLYFPEEPGATVLVEEREGRCTVLVREPASTSGALA